MVTKNIVKINTKLGNIEIGDGLPVHLIAEIGLNHNGSIYMAKKMIEAAAFSGATFVKFQKRSPLELASLEFLKAPFQKCPSLGATQLEVRNRLELSKSEYQELIEYSESLGVIFFATAFDLKSLDFLIDLDLPIFKLASHSMTNGPLIKRISELNIPIICSLGGLSEEEIIKSLGILKNNDKIIMHCVSSYPTSDANAYLDTITKLKSTYSVPIGFSSHEIGTDLSFAAAAIGATIIERHFTINRAMIGLDQSISIQPNEMSILATQLKRLHQARGIKDNLLQDEISVKANYHVGVYSKINIKKGSLLKERDLCCKQPLISKEKYFTGLEYFDLLGRKIKKDLSKGSIIPREFVEL